MYTRFRALPIMGQIIVVMIVLFTISVLWPIIVVLLQTLVKLAVAAVIIVGLLWLFDKVRSDDTGDSDV
jgi:hypothetical protein